MITIEIRGGEGFKNVLLAKRDLLLNALRQKIDALDAMLQMKVQGKMEGDVVQSHTHHAAGSVRVIPAKIDGNVVRGSVEAGGGVAPYFRFIEEGTAPHLIRPVNKQALAFMIDGKQVFAKLVHHPGTKATHLLRDSFDELRDIAADELQKTVDEVISGT